MMGLAELKGRQDLINEVDWEMGPEEAVRLYLEWGNNWSRGYRMVRSKDDETLYFVLDTWEEVPVVRFIKRASGGAVELARIEVPEELRTVVRQRQPARKGVYSLDDELRKWLRRELDS